MAFPAQSPDAEDIVRRYFVLEQSPAEGGVWLPSHFTMQTHAKVFLLFSHHEQEDSGYYGYHKARATEAEAR